MSIFARKLLLSALGLASLSIGLGNPAIAAPEIKGRTTGNRDRHPEFTPPNRGRPDTAQGQDAYRTGGTPPQPFTPPSDDPAPKPRSVRSGATRGNEGAR